MTSTDLLLTVSMTSLGIVGYFLKTIHSDLKKCIEDVGKLKGKIELVQQEHNLRLEKTEAVTQQKIDRLTDEVTRLTKVLEKAFKTI
jgi:archaellum component FlaC